MTVRFQCSCGKKLKASDDKIGKRVLCPDCGEPVKIPAADKVPVETLEPAAAGTQGGPEKDSSQTARDLLKLSATANREAETAEPQPKPTRPRVPVSEVVRYFAVKSLPYAGIAAALGILYWLSWLMLVNPPKYPDLAPVEGTVTLNGRPLAGAEVMFKPEGAYMEEGIKPAESVGRTDESGRYSLQYVKGVEGAALGAHEVEISKIGPDGREVLPARYHAKTELTAEVTEGKNTIDFELVSAR